ncbi:achaete-scute homolog 3-like [Amblyomma americanum]
MDETALSPCPGKPLSSSVGEYVTLTPVMPTYPHHQQGHLHEQLAVAVHPHHQPAVAMFPTTGFFCGGPPETPLEMPDLPAVAAPSPDFSVNSDSEDSSSDKGGTTDPFAPECKIPLPVPYSAYDYWLEPTFIRRRNERERQRVRHVNDGFERLRSRLPLPPRDKDRRLSKVETLRYAISYIRHLQRLLGLVCDEDDEDTENSRGRR